jgi:hypothetical protein
LGDQRTLLRHGPRSENDPDCVKTAFNDMILL